MKTQAEDHKQKPTEPTTTSILALLLPLPKRWRLLRRAAEEPAEEVDQYENHQRTNQFCPEQEDHEQECKRDDDQFRHGLDYEERSDGQDGDDGYRDGSILDLGYEPVSVHQIFPAHEHTYSCNQQEGDEWGGASTHPWMEEENNMHVEGGD
ncbi:hypothetical protein BHE74_00053799 [Ensete ventricosum]|nr:hypothetical protein GW17_00017902 [Ensete ventricosum]RWW40754.1 hypothetical protein BHE74_00053799 [Ensete ventricosum]RZS25279.1 hypothetical protein BHM03_00058459 [Ensete ventricosum]